MNKLIIIIFIFIFTKSILPQNEIIPIEKILPNEAAQKRVNAAIKEDSIATYRHNQILKKEASSHLHNFNGKKIFGFITVMTGAIGCIAKIYNANQSYEYSYGGMKTTIHNEWNSVHTIYISFSIGFIALGFSNIYK